MQTLNQRSNHLMDNANSWIERNIFNPVNDPLKELDELYQQIFLEAETKGVNEGKANQPSTNASLHYEDVINRSFRSTSTKITTSAVAIITQLDVTSDALKQKITKHPYYEICVNLAKSSERIKQKLEAEIEYHKGKVRSYRSAFAVAQSLADRPSGQTNGSKFFLGFSMLFYACLIVLGILDLPFSIANFENLNFNRIETMLVSCAVVMSITLLSHFGGLSLKRYKYDAAYRNWTFVIFFIILGFLFGVTNSRYQYARQNEVAADTATFEDFDEPAIENSFVEQIQEFSLADLADPMFWLFFFINALILLAGIFLSYKVHDSDPNFEAAWCDVEFKVSKHEQAISDAENKINQQVSLTRVQIQTNQSMIDSSLESQVNEYEEALTIRNMLATYVNGIASQIEDKAIVVVNTYRANNMAHRVAPIPTAWNEAYSLDMPRLTLQENNILKFFKNEVT